MYILINGEFLAYAYEAITVANASIGFTETNYNPALGQTTLRAERAFFTVETAAIRYTIDGTTPTTTVGHLLSSGDIVLIDGYENIANFRAIRTGGTSASIKVTYMK